MLAKRRERLQELGHLSHVGSRDIDVEALESGVNHGAFVRQDLCGRGRKLSADLDGSVDSLESIDNLLRKLEMAQVTSVSREVFHVSQCDVAIRVLDVDMATTPLKSVLHVVALHELVVYRLGSGPGFLA